MESILGLAISWVNLLLDKKKKRLSNKEKVILRKTASQKALEEAFKEEKYVQKEVKTSSSSP